MGDVRIGIIGVGGFGLFCLQQYRHMPGVRVTAIAGTHPEKYARLAAEYDIPFHTTDWRQLATHPEVDIVYLATPPDLHHEQALAAIAAGKHVFCEKPLALTLAQADAMLGTAAQAGVRLGINFVMRYSALYDTVRTIVTEQLLGKPQRFLFENSAGDLPPGHWFWDPARSGGIPVEHGGHFFDIFTAIYGTGELRWAGRTRRPGGEEDKWLMVLQYGPQVLGSFYHAFDKPSAIEQTWAVLDFERGYLRLDGWIPERLQVDAVVTESAAARLAAVCPGIARTSLDGEQLMRANGAEVPVTARVHGVWSPGEKQHIYEQAVRDAMADFIAWTRDPAHHPRVTAREARAALEIALAAEAVARGQ